MSAECTGSHAWWTAQLLPARCVIKRSSLRQSDRTARLSPCPPSRPLGNSARIDGASFDETQRVLPQIFDVERSLTPRPHADGAARDALDIITREAPERFCAGKDGVKVFDREIQRLRRRVRLSN